MAFQNLKANFFTKFVYPERSNLQAYGYIIAVVLSTNNRFERINQKRPVLYKFEKHVWEK